MTVVVLSVPGVSCAHCEEALTAAVRPLTGVETVAVDVAGKTVTVDAGPGFDLQAALTAVGGAGYDVASVTETTR